jgi:lipid II:glycine glycyltransferase (peptidoglycan interpeptide bridge formation enzyme)
MQKLRLERSTLAQLQSQPEKTAAWNDFQASLPNGHVFQTTYWAEYRQNTGWTPIFLSLWENNTLRATSLVLHKSIKKLPIGGILYVSRGPVLDVCAPDAPMVFAHMLDALKGLARRRIALLRLSPDAQQDTPQTHWMLPLLNSKGFHKTKYPIQHTNTTRIDVSQPIEQLLANMDKKRRAEIRKYEENKVGWVLRCDNSLEALARFYALYSATLTKVHSRPKMLADLEILLETLRPAKAIYVFNMEYEGRLMAGALRLAVGKRLWGLYSGTIKDDNTISGPGTGLAMHWELIKWAKSHDFEDYDLQGFPMDSQPGDPLYGVYLFKRKWGGAAIRLIGEFDFAPYPFIRGLLESRLAQLKAGENAD